jgi:hypothetical protein
MSSQPTKKKVPSINPEKVYGTDDISIQESDKKTRKGSTSRKVLHFREPLND